MYYALVLRVRHNGKIRKFGVVNQYGEMSQPTYSELMRHVRKGEVVNLAPNGDYFTGKNCNITDIPLLDSNMNQIGGIDYDSFYNAAINEIQRHISLDQQKEQSKIEEKQSKIEEEQSKRDNKQYKEVAEEQKKFFEHVREEQSDIDKSIDKISELASEAVKQANKRINRDKYLKYLESIEKYLDKASSMLEQCLRVKRLTNYELKQSGQTEYKRSMDARTNDQTMNNYICKFGIIELRNRIGALYNQARNIINSELTSGDKEFYTQRLQIIKDEIMELQSLHRETSNILKENTKIKEDAIASEQAEKEKQHNIQKEVMDVKNKLNKVRAEIVSIKFNPTTFNSCLSKLNGLSVEIDRIYYEISYEEVKGQVDTLVTIITQQLEDKMDTLREDKRAYDEKQEQLDRDRAEKERLEQERLEQERLEKERLEQERLLKEAEEAERLRQKEEEERQQEIERKTINNLIAFELRELKDRVGQTNTIDALNSIEVECNEIVSRVGIDILNTKSKDIIHSIETSIADRKRRIVSDADNNIQKIKEEAGSILANIKGKVNYNNIDIEKYAKLSDELYNRVELIIKNGYTADDIGVTRGDNIKSTKQKISLIVETAQNRFNELKELEEESLRKEQKEKEEYNNRLSNVIQYIDSLDIVDNSNELVKNKKSIETYAESLGFKYYNYPEEIKKKIEEYSNKCHKAIDDRQKEEKRLKEEKAKQMELEREQQIKDEIASIIKQIESLNIESNMNSADHNINDILIGVKTSLRTTPEVKEAVSKYKEQCRKEIKKFEQQDLMCKTKITNGLTQMYYDSLIDKANTITELKKIQQTIQSVLDKKCDILDNSDIHDSDIEDQCIRAITKFANTLRDKLNNKYRKLYTKEHGLVVKPYNLSDVIAEYESNIDYSDNILNKIGAIMLREIHKQLSNI